MDQALAKLRSLAGSGATDGYTRILKALADSSPARPPAVPDGMVDLVESAVPAIPCKDLGLWTWSLGKIGFDSTIPRHKNIMVSSMTRLLACNPSGRDLATALQGMVAAQTNITQLSHTHLMDCIGTVTLDARGTSNVLNSLGKLGVDWGAIPAATHTVIWKTLETHSSTLDSLNASLILHSLGVLGVDCESLVRTRRKLLFRIVDRAVMFSQPTKPTDICAQLSMTVIGLSKMGLIYAFLPSESAQSVQKALDSHVPMMAAQGLANVIHSLGIMKWHTSILPTLRSAMVKQVDTMHLSAIASSVYGLAMIGKWGDLGADLQTALDHSLASKLAACHGHTLSTIIYSLGVLGAPWHALSDKLRDAVTNAMVTQQQLNALQLANILLGLAKMGVIWKQLPITLTHTAEQALMSTASSMNEQHISNVLSSLAIMQVAWSDLQLDTLQAVVGISESVALTRKGHSNAMYALVMMAFDSLSHTPTDKVTLLWRLIRVVLIRCKTISTYEPEDYIEYNRRLHFFNLLETVPEGMQLIVDILGSKPAAAGVTISITPEVLPAVAAELAKALKRDALTVTNSLGGVAVHHQDRLIAFVEVGYNHNSRWRQDRVERIASGVAIYHMHITSSSADAIAAACGEVTTSIQQAFRASAAAQASRKSAAN